MDGLCITGLDTGLGNDSATCDINMPPFLILITACKPFYPLDV